MILDRDRISYLMSEILIDPDYHYECTQVAITGPNTCAILFETGDADHDRTISVIFEVEDFDPAKSRPVMITENWLFSLSATNTEDLSALEVGRDVWRGAPDNWARRNAANWFCNRLWCHDPTTTFLIGVDGLSCRFNGTTYAPIKPGRKTLLFDIHGRRGSKIYSVGAAGTLQRLDGEAWSPIDLSLSTRFRGVDATRPELLRFCGDDGACFELRDESELIPISAPESTFFTVRQWQGNVYWGDSWFGVYRQNGAELEEFHETRLGYDLRCDDDFLYCVGTDTAWRFDGDTWKSLRLHYQDGGFTLV